MEIKEFHFPLEKSAESKCPTNLYNTVDFMEDERFLKRVR